MSVVLELLPVVALLSLFALDSCWSALPFTSLPDPSPLPLSPLAPAALASASVVVVEAPVAEKLIAAPLRVRESVAVTSSSGTASASASPITTSPVVASAFAVVVADAVCFADRLIAPAVVSVWEVSPAIDAVVRSVGSEIAASAVKARSDPLPPPAPASA